MSEKIKFLWCVAKNGLCEPYKLKIVKEGKKTFTTDELVGKRVFKAYECKSPLVGYNTYCFYYNNEEFALKQFNYLKEKNNNTTHKQITELKQQLAENAQHTEQLLKENAQLKKNIKQKDKEIETIKLDLTIAQNDYNMLKSDYIKMRKELFEELKDQRHQICEKIRQWYREQELIMEDWLIDCLDQIEKGGQR